MKRLLATTAITLLAAGPLAAQTAPSDTSADAQAAPAAGDMSGGGLFVQTNTPDEIFGSDLIGMSVYSSDAQYDDSQPVTADARANWDDIGEVDDLLITPEGQVKAALVDVGGFLGMGEHRVALDMSMIHMLRDDTGDEFVAVNSSEDALKAAPEFQRTEPMNDATAMGVGTAGAGGAMAPASNGMAPATDMASDQSASPAGNDMSGDNNMATDNTSADTAPTDQMAADQMGTRPTVEQEGYSPVDYATLTADELKGATVYDTNNDDIGDVDELVLDPDGKISKAVVDVGGFLGMGAHSVALDFSELQILKGENDDIRVYIDASKDELEKRPEYEG